MTNLSLQPAEDAMFFAKEDAVTLIVGPEKRELLVHGNCIARNSVFFETALKKEWHEGQTRSISLPTDDYETMTRYLRFTYGDELLDEPGEDDVFTGRKTAMLEKIQTVYTYVAKLYVLGHRLMDDTVKQAAITEIHGLFMAFWSCTGPPGAYNPGPDAVNIISKGTMEGDPARRLVVDIHMKYPHDPDTHLQTNPSFLYDLAQVYTQNAREDLSPIIHQMAKLDLDDYLV